MLMNLADVSRSAGLKTVEQSGWRTRGHGEMSQINVITCHHTAGGRSKKPRLSLDVIQNGRPGLDGPLAHYYLDRDGTVYVVAAGLCWHAGASRSDKWTNSHAIGIEAEAAGDGWSEDWPPVQMDAYRRLCHALMKAYKLDTSEVRGHKETCIPVGRKTDPSFSMPSFRDSIDELPIRPRPEQQREEIDMFIANYGNDWYLVGVAGKRKITKMAADELRVEAKVPYVGAGISAPTLSEFPTYDEANQTVGGNTAAMITATHAGVKDLLERGTDTPA